MIGLAELARRFDFHPATDEEKRNAHASIRQAHGRLAEQIDRALPDGREKATALTNLEQSMFWANAGLARP